MTKTITLLGCILILLRCGAQQRELDSLSRLLAAHPVADTVRLNLLNDIAFDYNSIDPGRGLAIADEAINLAKDLHNDPKLAAAYNYKAVNLMARGEDSLAITLYKKAVLIHQRTGNLLRLANTYNNLGIAFANLSDYPQALDYHNKAFQTFESLGQKQKMANSLNNIGVIYLYVADYAKALDNYLKALRVLEQTDDRQGTAAALSNVGLVYDHLNRWDLSLDYHRKALDLYEKAGDQYGMTNALGNMGNVYHDMDNSGQALDYYKKALAICRQSGNRRGVAANYANMGAVYIGLTDYTLALSYFKQSLAINSAIGNKQRMSNDCNQIGRIYREAPDDFLRRQGTVNRYVIAKTWMERGLAIAATIGSADLQRDAWENLYRLFEKEQLPDKALQAYQQYRRFGDSVTNTEMKQQITRMEMQFEFDKKEALARLQHEKEQATALAEIKRQGFITHMAILVACVVLIATLGLFYFYKRKQKAEFRTTVAVTELKALRAQMNPHFIFNSMNSIIEYMHTFDTVTASAYAVKFARLMRMILEYSERELITVSEELQALELYLQLEALRQPGKFNWTIRVDVDKETTAIPPLILQPFVENCVWHGFAKKKEGGMIVIEIHREADSLVCVIKDNGPGIGKNTEPIEKMPTTGDSRVPLSNEETTRSNSAPYTREKAGNNRMPYNEKTAGSNEVSATGGNGMWHGRPGETGTTLSLGMKITRSRIAILNRSKHVNASFTITDLHHHRDPDESGDQHPEKETVMKARTVADTGTGTDERREIIGRTGTETLPEAQAKTETIERTVTNNATGTDLAMGTVVTVRLPFIETF